jgi:hypothetical protein
MFEGLDSSWLGRGVQFSQLTAARRKQRNSKDAVRIYLDRSATFIMAGPAQYGGATSASGGMAKIRESQTSAGTLHFRDGVKTDGGQGVEEKLLAYRAERGETCAWFGRYRSRSIPGSKPLANRLLVMFR